MKKNIVLLMVAVVAILFTGCAQKVKVKALQPAEVGEMASKKKVAIMSFHNDKIGLSSKIEAQISKHKLDEKRYFTVLSRKNINKVLKEQKLQSSEVMDEKTATKVGKLIGAQALINGDVSSSGKESSYKKQITECLEYYKDGKCATWNKKYVTCQVTKVSVAASINIINMETASIIYADNITKAYSADSCKVREVLSKNQAIQTLAARVANEFVYKLTPHYIYFDVELLDSIEFEVSELQEKQLEAALKYVEAGRFDKAERIMTKLHKSLNARSYVIAYDLGVIKEARGEFDQAKVLYAVADETMLEPIEAINKAVLRIDKLISDRERAKSQINKK